MSTPPSKSSPWVERLFEGGLWHSRLVVLVAVLASLATALAVFYIATVDAWYLITHLGEYASPELTAEARRDLRASSITHVVEVIDGYLLATVLLIFALGLYELFISPLDPAHESRHFSRVLFIRSLDDLKSRLGQVVLMILIVKFFEHAIEMRFDTAMDLLAFAGGIALVGVALYLSHAGEHPGANEPPGSAAER